MDGVPGAGSPAYSNISRSPCTAWYNSDWTDSCSWLCQNGPNFRKPRQYHRFSNFHGFVSKEIALPRRRRECMESVRGRYVVGVGAALVDLLIEEADPFVAAM